MVSTIARPTASDAGQRPARRIEDKAEGQAAAAGPPAIRPPAPPCGLFFGHDQQGEGPGLRTGQFGGVILRRAQRGKVCDARDDTASEKQFRIDWIVGHRGVLRTKAGAS